MSYYPAANTYIRTLYAPGYSSLMMSYFKTNVTLDFALWLSMDNVGHSQYDRKNRLSTSVNSEGAAFFYQIAMSIIEGEDSEKQIEAVLPCSNNATLIFEYKPDQDNQMSAYLTINKNNATIPFKFSIQRYKVNVNGQMVTKNIQVGLGVFAMTFKSYLYGTGSDLHLSKLSEEELDPELTPSPVENNNQYQTM